MTQGEQMLAPSATPLSFVFFAWTLPLDYKKAGILPLSSV